MFDGPISTEHHASANRFSLPMHQVVQAQHRSEDKQKDEAEEGEENMSTNASSARLRRTGCKQCTVGEGHKRTLGNGRVRHWSPAWRLRSRRQRELKREKPGRSVYAATPSNLCEEVGS